MNAYTESNLLNQTSLKRLLVSFWAFENRMPIDSDEGTSWKEDALSYGHFFEDFLGRLDFDHDKYFISDEEFKEPTANVIEAVENYLQLDIEDEEEKRLKALEGLYTNTKKRELRLALWERCQPFLEFKLKDEHRQRISSDRYALAISQKDFIESIPEWKHQVIEPKEGCELLRKVQIFTDKYKGELDIIEVDHERQVLTIIDVKTCPNPIDKFLFNCSRYRYDFQIAFYYMILRLWKEDHYPEYTVNRQAYFMVGSNSSIHPPVRYKISAGLGLVDRKVGNRLYKGVYSALDLYDEYLRRTSTGDLSILYREEVELDQYLE